MAPFIPRARLLSTEHIAISGELAQLHCSTIRAACRYLLVREADGTAASSLTDFVKGLNARPLEGKPGQRFVYGARPRRSEATASALFLDVVSDNLGQ